ncbi:chloramphenicol phosphotransferase CPT family protein [Streptomyces sp. NPDC005017]|uniref:chloramphenicol phosphotransferase CPT family protein n=1 Tax=Streptomyces sp. NPDC005017 TaxID=3364706 RepID=UPI00367B96BE
MTAQPVRDPYGPQGAPDPDDPENARVPGTPAGGTVILLNGASSSGKSSIARELLTVLDGTWFHLPVDAFHALRGGVVPEGGLQAEIDRTCKGFHRAVAGMAAGGNNLVVDHPLSRRWRLLDLLDVLDPGNTVLVAVRCPLSELERREAERGDRQRGLAALQYPHVHSHGPHDLDVDTGRESPAECARRVRDFLADRRRPTAFEALRRAYGR